jgi:hypothetical protein
MRFVIPILAAALVTTVAPSVEAQDLQLQWPAAQTAQPQWPVANGAPTLDGNPVDGVHHFNTTFLWLGGGAFVLSYGAKIPNIYYLMEDSRGAYDTVDHSYSRSCWDQTAALTSIPALGGLLGLVSGYACENNGYRQHLDGDGGHNYKEHPFEEQDATQVGAWIAFGVDLVGIVFTTLGLIGYSDVGWEDLTEHDVGGHTVRASLGAPGADVGGLSVSLDL